MNSRFDTIPPNDSELGKAPEQQHEVPDISPLERGKDPVTYLAIKASELNPKIRELEHQIQGVKSAAIQPGETIDQFLIKKQARMLELESPLKNMVAQQKELTRLSDEAAKGIIDDADAYLAKNQSELWERARSLEEKLKSLDGSAEQKEYQQLETMVAVLEEMSRAPQNKKNKGFGESVSVLRETMAGNGYGKLQKEKDSADSGVKLMEDRRKKLQEFKSAARGAA